MAELIEIFFSDKVYVTEIVAAYECEIGQVEEIHLTIALPATAHNRRRAAEIGAFIARAIESGPSRRRKSWSKNAYARTLARQKNRCAGCGKEFSEQLLAELDHIMPLALGGEDTERNLQGLCRECNGNKGASDPIAHNQEKGLLL